MHYLYMLPNELMQTSVAYRYISLVVANFTGNKISIYYIYMYNVCIYMYRYMSIYMNIYENIYVYINMYIYMYMRIYMCI